jgi:hypothetical protein
MSQKEKDVLRNGERQRERKMGEKEKDVERGGDKKRVKHID